MTRETVIMVDRVEENMIQLP